MKKFLFYLLITILIIVVMVGYFFHTLNKALNNAKKLDSIEKITFVHKLPENYSFDFKKLKYLPFKGTIYSKTRNPIVTIDYNGYSIFIYKLQIESKQPLTKIIVEDSTSVNPTTGVTYHTLSDDSDNPYSLMYKAGQSDNSMQKIYLTLAGYNTQLIEKNDSVEYYYSQLDNFSIRYKQDGEDDFYGKVRDSLLYKLPLQIAFKKHKDHIYLFLAIVNRNNTGMKYGMLPDMRKNNFFK